MGKDESDRNVLWGPVPIANLPPIPAVDEDLFVDANGSGRDTRWLAAMVISDSSWARPDMTHEWCVLSCLVWQREELKQLDGLAEEKLTTNEFLYAPFIIPSNLLANIGDPASASLRGRCEKGSLSFGAIWR